MEKAIKDWKHIFLDTTVIIDFLTPKRLYNTYENNLKTRIEKTHKLFNYFEASNSKINFYISAITIAELTKQPEKPPVNEYLIELFNSADVTFVDYTTDIALDINKNLSTYLPNTHINQFISKLEKKLKENGFFNARQWILDDLKIISSAHFLPKLDIVLTGDKKTFIPIAEKFQVPVYYTLNLPEDLFGGIDIKNAH